MVFPSLTTAPNSIHYTGLKTEVAFFRPLQLSLADDPAGVPMIPVDA